MQEASNQYEVEMCKNRKFASIELIALFPADYNFSPMWMQLSDKLLVYFFCSYICNLV